MSEQEWSKKFDIFFISRESLEALGFDHEYVASLSDEEMQALADAMQKGMQSIFIVTVKVITQRYLEQIQAYERAARLQEEKAREQELTGQDSNKNECI